MARKFALIIGNSEYDDSGLACLKTPDADVVKFADVLRSPEIGGFDEVKKLVNQPTDGVRREIARFFAEKKRDDLLLLYFSGHGVLDEQGQLYLAVRDTERSMPKGTAIEASFITYVMDTSNSKQKILILDCCHSGAFARGSKGAVGRSVGTATAFKGTGFGRIVLTATDATQYAWEGDRVKGDTENSVFTRYLIQGLETGEADRDNDGQIDIDELYDYVHAGVIDETPKQTPRKWAYQQEGKIIIARSVAAARKAEEEHLAREKAAAEQLAAQQVEAARIAKEKTEQKRLAREKAEADRLARQKVEAERAARKKAVQEQQALKRAAAIAAFNQRLRKIFTRNRIFGGLIALGMLAGLYIFVSVESSKTNAASVSATQTAIAIAALPSSTPSSTAKPISTIVPTSTRTPSATFTSTPAPAATLTPSLPSVTPLPTVIPTIAADLWDLHQVCPGQSLSQIAIDYGTTVDILASVNQISDLSVLTIDSWLLIPESTEPIDRPEFFSYRVAFSDTLYSIAERYSTSVAVIGIINNLANPDVIYSGYELSIPLGLVRANKIKKCTVTGTLRSPTGGNVYLRATTVLSPTGSEPIVADGAEMEILGQNPGKDRRGWYKVNSITTSGTYRVGWLPASWIRLVDNVSFGSIPYTE